MSEEILSHEQRTQLVAFAGVEAGLPDNELLAAAAEKIGMTGELAVDPEGDGLELERDGILVALDAVPAEDAGEVEHPEQLYLAVYLRPADSAERESFEDADLLEPADDIEELDEGWLYAWWGSGPTSLSRSSALHEQMQLIERVMSAAEGAVAGRAVEIFTSAVGDVLLPDDDVDDDD